MIEIRLYEDKDFQSLCQLCQGVAEYYKVGKIPNPREMQDYVRNHVLGSDSDVKVLMAFAKGTGAGMASFSIMYPSPSLMGQLYLKELYVDEEYRGIGVGEKLMKTLARYAIDHNCSRMDWSAETNNPSALEFYQTIGAKPLEKKVYYRIADTDLISFADSD